MKILTSLHTLAALLCVVLSACASTPAALPQEFDFAPLLSSNATNSGPKSATATTFSIAEISAPAALDTGSMLYRLQYGNVQLLRPYAQHRWSASPAKLLAQRFKGRFAAEGLNVVSASDGISNSVTLKIDLDEFEQVFSSTTQSTGRVALRISLIKGRTLLAQRSFQQTANANSADAAGGAKALQQASDALISDVLAWLGTIPLN